MDFLIPDKRFFVEKGDPGFNPAWNKMVIKKTIEHNKVNRKRLEKEYDEKLAERVDAVATYLMHANEKDTPVEKYFGHRELERLQSRKLVRIIQGAKQKLGWIE